MIKLVILITQSGYKRERIIKLSNTDLQQLMQLNYEETEELIKERYLSEYDTLISFEWRIVQWRCMKNYKHYLRISR